MKLRRFIKVSPQIRLSMRAAVCLSAPLVVGVIIHQRDNGIIFGIGALWAISQDGLDEWRVRGRRLLTVAASGGIGVAVGSSVVAHNSSQWALVALSAIVAVVAGFIEVSKATTAGAYLLIGSILGSGLNFQGRIAQSTAAIVLGSLWVYVVAALMDRRSRLANQRAFLAISFNTLATVIDNIGMQSFHDERARAVTALDVAQDVIGTSHLRATSVEAIAIRQCLVVALRCGEVISYLEGKGLTVDATLATSFRQVASTLHDTSGQAAVAMLRDLARSYGTSSGLDPVITSALSPVEPADIDVRSLRASARALNRAQLPVRERLRFAIILALAVVAATLVARALDGTHGYWLPLAVAFILRPDLGPVITRALARTVGTVVGVGIAALVALGGNSIVSLIVLSCAMAAIMPFAVRRSHVWAVMTFTPIVFIFLSLLGTDRYLFGPRILDTTLAAAIVLTLDVLLWTTAPSLRPAQQLTKAQAAAQRYESETSLDNPSQRHRLRRSALRAVANARASLSQARSEPRLLRRHDPENAQQLDEIERSIDAHTVSLLEGRAR